MVSAKPVVKGYVAPELFSLFKEYCLERKATSASEGLELLLAEFFQEPIPLPPVQDELIEAVINAPEFTALKRKIAIQAALIDTLSYHIKAFESRLIEGGLLDSEPPNNGSPSSDSKESI